MNFHFYAIDDFVGRFQHLNMKRIKKEPIKIGKYFYNYMSHTTKDNTYVIILTEPTRVENKDCPKEYYEIWG